MSELLEDLLNFARRLFRAGDAIASAVSRDAVEVAMKELDEISNLESVSGFFGRVIETKEIVLPDGSSVLRVLGKDGEIIDNMTARVLGNFLQSGDLVKAAQILEPDIKVSVETAQAFSELASNSPIGAFGKLMEDVTEMRTLIDSMPDTFRRVIKNADEFEEAIRIGNKRFKSNYDKLLSIMSTSQSVGSIAITIIGGLSVYELLKKHAENASGCYRIQSVLGTPTNCKTVEYSITKQASKKCGDVHSVRTDKPDWNQPNGYCLLACNNDYLVMSENEKTYIAYQCINMDIWDAMGDIIHGVVNPIENLFNLKLLLSFGAVVTAAYVGVNAMRFYQNSRTNSFQSTNFRDRRSVIANRRKQPY